MNRFSVLVAAGCLAAALGVPSIALAHDVTPEQIQAAKTPADHESIAKAYDEAAAHAESTAATHRGMAAAYRSSNSRMHTWSPNVVRHCENLAKQADASAKDYRELAAEHRKMAASAR